TTRPHVRAFSSHCVAPHNELSDSTNEGLSKVTAMSALGQKQTYAAHKIMSALPPKADMCSALGHVRFGPIADIHSSAPTERKTPGNCPGFSISRSGYVESARAFRQASACPEGKVRLLLRRARGDLQHFIGDVEGKRFFFILYRVVHHG